MLPNPYVQNDILNFKKITSLHNLIIQQHKDFSINQFKQQNTESLSLSPVSFANKKSLLIQEDNKPLYLSESPLTSVFEENYNHESMSLPKNLKIIKNRSLSKANTKHKTRYLYGKNKSSFAITAKIEKNLLLKRNRMLRFFTKTKRWSPTEKFLFYRGLREFGLEFSLIHKEIMPHRNEKEIYEFFKKEDKNDNNRIDNSLEFHRAHYKIKKDDEIAECSIFNSSLDNAFAGECNECMMIRINMGLDYKNIPSLDSVLEETKF